MGGDGTFTEDHLFCVDVVVDRMEGFSSGDTGSLKQDLGHELTISAGNPSKGKYTAGMRLYDPLTGRFTEEDPMMQETCGVQDQNLYTYCFNQPMTLVDIDGCFPSFSDTFQAV